MRDEKKKEHTYDHHCRRYTPSKSWDVLFLISQLFFLGIKRDRLFFFFFFSLFIVGDNGGGLGMKVKLKIKRELCGKSI